MWMKEIGTQVKGTFLSLFFPVSSTKQTILCFKNWLDLTYSQNFVKKEKKRNILTIFLINSIYFISSILKQKEGGKVML